MIGGLIGGDRWKGDVIGGLIGGDRWKGDVIGGLEDAIGVDKCTCLGADNSRVIAQLGDKPPCPPSDYAGCALYHLDRTRHDRQPV